MTYAAEVLADSPWGFWEQGEASGTTLADSSGNARSLTITGTPSLAQAGPSGSTADAIAWPSSATTEHYAASSVTVSTAVCTLEAWVKLTANPTALTPIIATAASYGNGAQRITLYVNTTGKVGWMTYRGGTNAVHLFSTGSLSLDAWHHVIASIGPAGAKIRVDKATVGSDGGTAIAAGAETLFLHGGGNSDANSAFTNGSPITIARPAFYTTQLSDARTDAHYDALGGGGSGGSGSISLAGNLPAIQSSMSFRVRVGTATTNRANGRRREGIAYVTDTTPPEPMPANLVRAQRVVKAIAYPTPTLVDGRPT